LLYNNDINNGFLTSDFPIAIENSQSFKVFRRIIPLTPTFALRITPNNNKSKNQNNIINTKILRKKVNLQEVYKINRLIVQSAENLIFYKKKFNEFTSLVKKNQCFNVNCECQVSSQSGEEQIMIAKYDVNTNLFTASKIYLTVSDDTLIKMQKISNKTKKSFSKTGNEIIEDWFKNQERYEKKEQLFENAIKRHEEYLLKTVAINAEILRKIYNKPSMFETDNPNEILELINKVTKKHIEEKC